MSEDSIRQNARDAEASLKRASDALKNPTRPQDAAEPQKPIEGPSPGLSLDATGNADEAAEAEQLKAELQKQRVEQGRLKKASDELAATKAELAEAKRKLAELDSRSAEERALGYIDPTRRDIVDEDVMMGSADIAKGIVGESEARLQARLDALEAQVSRTTNAPGEAHGGPVEVMIDKEFPGFLRQTTRGGQWEQAWGTFLGTEDPATGTQYQVSIRDAYARQRMAGVSRVIEAFYKETGFTRMASLQDAVLPSGSASAIGDGRVKGDSNVYTTGEMDAALKKARDQYDRGEIDGKTRNAITLKYQTAVTEGRVVRGAAR